MAAAPHDQIRTRVVGHYPDAGLAE